MAGNSRAKLFMAVKREEVEERETERNGVRRERGKV